MKHLEKFQEEIKSKYNLDFGFVVTVPILASDLPAATIKAKPVFQQGILDKSGNKGNSEKIVRDENEIIIKISNTNEDCEITSTTDSAAACNRQRSRSVSTDQAISKLNPIWTGVF